MPIQSEIRSTITNRIVAALKAGTIPWRKPWSGISDPVRIPTNLTTKRAYRGMNVMLLWLAGQERGYPVSYWASFNQWKSIGAKVRKGEKATQIVFWKPVTKHGLDDDGKETKQTFPILKTWSVFNVGQVEGKAVEQFQTPSEVLPRDFGTIDRSEFDTAVAATSADIRHGFNHAAYHRLPGDYIVMPNEDQFESFPAYAETLLHELAHWSEHRLDWNCTYAEGELRAEIASCFLASALGIPNSDDLTNHAAYVQSWLKAMGDDPKFIFKAATAACKATDFILGFSKPQIAEQLDEEPVSEAA